MPEKTEPVLTNVLVLTFRDQQNGKSKSVRVPKPRPDLKASNVKKVMEKMAAVHYLWDSSFDMVPYTAKVVQTTSSSLDITVSDD